MILKLIVLSETYRLLFSSLFFFIPKKESSSTDCKQHLSRSIMCAVPNNFAKRLQL